MPQLNLSPCVTHLSQTPPANPSPARDEVGAIVRGVLLTPLDAMQVDGFPRGERSPGSLISKARQQSPSQLAHRHFACQVVGARAVGMVGRALAVAPSTGLLPAITKIDEDPPLSHLTHPSRRHSVPLDSTVRVVCTNLIRYPGNRKMSQILLATFCGQRAGRAFATGEAIDLHRVLASWKALRERSPLPRLERVRGSPAGSDSVVPPVPVSHSTNLLQSQQPQGMSAATNTPPEMLAIPP